MLDPLFVLLDLSRCLATLKVSFLLREGPFSMFQLSLQPRIKFEKIMMEKSFDSIVEMNKLYSILMENVVVAETSDFVQAFALLLGAFYVFNVEYPK